MRRASSPLSSANHGRLPKRDAAARWRTGTLDRRGQSRAGAGLGRLAATAAHRDSRAEKASFGGCFADSPGDGRSALGGEFISPLCCCRQFDERLTLGSGRGPARRLRDKEFRLLIPSFGAWGVAQGTTYPLPMAKDTPSLQRSYEDVLDLQLRNLKEALLQQYQADLSQLCLANTGRKEEPEQNSWNDQSLSENGGFDADFMSGSVPSATGSTPSVEGGYTRKWVSFTLRLQQKVLEDPTSDVENDSVDTLTSDQCAIHMRAVWGKSLDANMEREKTGRQLGNTLARTATLRVREARFTESSPLQFLVVGPQSKWQLFWAFMASAFILWDLITIPLEMFNLINVLDVVGYVTFSFWVLDIPLHFIFGVQLDGAIELRPSVLARLYMRSWLLADVFIVTIDAVIITLETIDLPEVGGAVFRSARYLRTLRLLRMIRLLRVAKLQRELSLLANRFLSTHAFMVMKIVAHLLMMLAINHLIACCWYGVGSWNADGRNWLALAQLEEASFLDHYTSSLHWALTQFTPSTNNIAPDNGWERFFAIWVILLAMGVFSSFVGSISSTVNSLRSARVEHIKRHSKLLQFFIERNLSLELYGKVQSALRKGEVEVRLQETEAFGFYSSGFQNQE
eukprot:s2925_g1.t1